MRAAETGAVQPHARLTAYAVQDEVERRSKQNYTNSNPVAKGLYFTAVVFSSFFPTLNV